MQLKKVLKVTLISVVSMLLVVIAGVVVLVTLVNPNHFKPFIAKAVYEATGRTLGLNGNISWKIYPNLGLNIQQLSLSNPRGFKPTTMLLLNSADVSVALLPLLTNHVVVKTLAVDGLKIGLLQQNGLNNWTFTPPNPAESTPDAGAAAPKPLRLELSAFSLTNASFSYDNFDSKVHQALKNFNFVVDTGFGGIVKYDSAADLLDLAKVDFNFNDQAIGKLNFKLEKLADPSYSGDIQLSKLAATQLMTEFAISQGKKMAFLDQVSLSAAFSGDAHNLDLKDCNFNFNESIKGKLNLVLKNLANPSYSGRLNLEKLDLNQVLNGLNIAMVERKGKPLLNRLALKTSFNGNRNNLNLAGLSLTVGDILPVSSKNIQIKNFAKPSFAGDILLPEFNLNKVLDGLGLAVAERKSKPLLNRFSYSSQFKGSTSSIELANLKFKAGGLVQGNGNLQVQNFSNPSFSGNINLPEFNLNQTLDGVNVAVAERKNQPLFNSFSYSSQFKGSLTSIAISGFKLKAGGIVQANGNVQVQNFTSPKYSGDINLPTFSLTRVLQQLAIVVPDIANKAKLEQVALSSGFAGGSNNLNLTNLRLKLANTNLSGNLNVTSIKPLAFSENISIDQLDVADFSNVNGFRVPLKQIHVNGNSSFSGSASSGIASSGLAGLNGKQNLQIENITLLGISLDKLVGQLDASIGHTGGNSGDIVRTLGNSAQVIQAVNNMKAEVARATVAGKRDLSQKTNLGAFSANLSLQNGVANPSSFKLSGPSVAISGNGQANLGQKTLNYKVKSQLLVAGINPIFKRLTFPATLEGSFNNPSASLDWGSIQQQILAQAFDSNKQQIKQVISSQLNQALGNGKGATNPNSATSTPNNQPVNQAVDAVSKAATNVLGNIFGK